MPDLFSAALSEFFWLSTLCFFSYKFIFLHWSQCKQDFNLMFHRGTSVRIAYKTECFWIKRKAKNVQTSVCFSFLTLYILYLFISQISALQFFSSGRIFCFTCWMYFSNHPWALILNLPAAGLLQGEHRESPSWQMNEVYNKEETAFRSALEQHG